MPTAPSGFYAYATQEHHLVVQVYSPACSSFPQFSSAYVITYTIYRESLAREKFGEFGESTMICQTNYKPSKLVLYNNNLLADLLIRQTFFHQMLEKNQFAKLFRYTVVIHPCDYRHKVQLCSMKLWWDKMLHK